MRKFSVDSKSGFRCNSNSVKIFDRNNNIFYVRKAKTSPLFFNLPKGVYMTPDTLIKQSCPIIYVLPKFTPLFEKNRVFPKDIKVVFAANPNKASIALTKDRYTIIVDNSIKAKGRLFYSFVINHELGHHFYKLEDGADFAAYVNMINQGYNPSQIFYAAAFTLNKNISGNRLLNLFNLNSQTYGIT